MIAGPDATVRGWGLTLRSDFALPGAMRGGADPVDLEIVRGTVDPAGVIRADGPYRLGRNGLEFAMPGLARYLCTSSRIVVEEAPGAPAADVAAMLIATAIPAVLWMRGEVVLHAAAAILPGATGAVAVLGRSGSGKSTWLARAAATGAMLVADDSVCVRGALEEPTIGGLPGGYFAPLIAAGDDGRAFHRVPAERQAALAAPGMLIVVDDGLPHGRLSGIDAVRALLTHRHRPRVARLLGVDGAALDRIVALCRHVTVRACSPAQVLAVDLDSLAL